MVRFQIPSLISFGLRKYYHLRLVNFHWPKLFEDDISVIYDKFSSMKLLLVGQLLADSKLLVVTKHLVDNNLFPVGKCLVDTKCLVSIQIVQILHIWHICHIWQLTKNSNEIAQHAKVIQLTKPVEVSRDPYSINSKTKQIRASTHPSKVLQGITGCTFNSLYYFIFVP